MNAFDAIGARNRLEEFVQILLRAGHVARFQIRHGVEDAEHIRTNCPEAFKRFLELRRGSAWAEIHRFRTDAILPWSSGWGPAYGASTTPEKSKS